MTSSVKFRAGGVRLQKKVLCFERQGVDVWLLRLLMFL